MTDDPPNGEAIVGALAAHLRALHAIPAAECPFDAEYAVRLAHALRRIDAGQVEEDDFDEARLGWSAEQVWRAMTALSPAIGGRVVTHGDYSLDNILVAEGRIVGLIDLGRVGVADPYQDLAILWNCLGEFDAGLQDRLFATYGIPLDRRRLEFHLMLDELF